MHSYAKKAKKPMALKKPKKQGLRTSTILSSSEIHPFIGRIVGDAEVVFELLTELIQGSLGLFGRRGFQFNIVLRLALLIDLLCRYVHDESFL